VSEVPAVSSKQQHLPSLVSPHTGSGAEFDGSRNLIWTEYFSTPKTHFGSFLSALLVAVGIFEAVPPSERLSCRISAVEVDSDSPETHTRVQHSLELLETDSYVVVSKEMRMVLKQFQILDSIVQTIAVFVMNVLGFKELSPKVGFHKKPMFVDHFSVS
jgi:hypothetical protein